MEKTVLPEVLRAYGIMSYKVLPPQKGYRNSSYAVITPTSTLNVIIYKHEGGMAARIERANSIGNFLANQGMVTRRTADTRILRLSSERQTRFCCLYEYLSGETIPWEAYTMERLKVLGQTMATMHTLLKRYRGLALPSIEEECLQLASRMRRYFKDPAVHEAIVDKLSLDVNFSQYDPVLRALEGAPHRQALHMDFVRSNVLFSGEAISGILDFEKCAFGHPVFDIARTLAFLMVDCKYKSEAQVWKYFLQSGYIKRGGGELTDIPPPVLHRLIQFFLWHDFYKFLRHNPYEFLSQNEHFLRTKALLVRDGLITEI